MPNVKRIVGEIKKEQAREDRIFKSLELNYRKNEVIMFFKYDEATQSDRSHHYIRHDHDPEFIDFEDIDLIIEEIKAMHIPYDVRRDEFM
ncbi:hypothetical protein K0018_09430 [Staphylococcus massiliensis]|uniref:hypothetical protein n=1 Tax=Staphylococcus massiliensis TaxID=555791 RepID=UPI001EDF8BBB|nr:hypothetical protein [Staphylococcus massiliensis]MCG3413268.1 hypothetical protein [Staphylococcus massiliensis]